MVPFCTLCGRRGYDRDLLCPRPGCPAQRAPRVLLPGSRLDDVELLRLVTLLPWAALYEGRRDRRTLYVKVAHDELTGNLLSREAIALDTLERRGARGSCLPRLVPIHGGARPALWGTALVGARRLRFTLFEPVPGEPLAALLASRHPPWRREAARLILGVSSAITSLQRNGVHPIGILPEGVMVHLDATGAPARLCLIDLGLVAGAGAMSPGELALLPAPRRPPELTADRGPTSAAEVYALGLVLLELLGASPDGVESLPRHEGSLVEVGRRAVSADPKARYSDAGALARAVAPYVTAVSLRPRRSGVEQFVLGAMVVLAVIFAVSLGFALAPHALYPGFPS